MRKVLPLLVFVALIGFMVFRKTEDPLQYSARLEVLRDAPLESGEGLHDLTLGKTTLADAISRYGAGHCSVIFGDESALEFSYAHTELKLFFRFETQLMNRLKPPLREIHRDPESYVLAQPELRKLVLDSISVQRNIRGNTENWYRGKLDGDVGLGAEGGALLALLSQASKKSAGPSLVAGAKVRAKSGRRYWFESRRSVVWVAPKDAADPDSAEALVRITLTRPARKTARSTRSARRLRARRER